MAKMLKSKVVDREQRHIDVLERNPDITSWLLMTFGLAFPLADRATIVAYIAGETPVYKGRIPARTAEGLQRLGLWEVAQYGGGAANTALEIRKAYQQARGVKKNPSASRLRYAVKIPKSSSAQKPIKRKASSFQVRAYHFDDVNGGHWSVISEGKTEDAALAVFAEYLKMTPARYRSFNENHLIKLYDRDQQMYLDTVQEGHSPRIKGMYPQKIVTHVRTNPAPAKGKGPQQQALKLWTAVLFARRQGNIKKEQAAVEKFSALCTKHNMDYNQASSAVTAYLRTRPAAILNSLV